MLMMAVVHSLFVGTKIGAATLEHSMANPQKQRVYHMAQLYHSLCIAF